MRREQLDELLDLLEEWEASMYRTQASSCRVCHGGPYHHTDDCRLMALLRRYDRRPPLTPAEDENGAQRGFQADLEVVVDVDRAVTYKNVHRRVRANAQEGLPPPDAVLEYLRGRTGPLGGEG